MKARILVRGLVFMATLAVLGFVLRELAPGSLLDTAWIDADVRGKGFAGEALFVAAGVVLTGVGLPRQMVAFLGGYAFGFLGGTGLALLATVGGCIVSFSYARFLGRDLVAGRFSERVGKVDAFLRDNPFSMTLLIRFLPLGSNLLTNLAAGVSSVGAVAFVSGSAVGYVPQTVIFALVGSGISVEPTLRIGLSAILFVAAGGLGVTLYRRYRHGHTLDDAMERQLGTAGDVAAGDVAADEPRS